MPIRSGGTAPYATPQAVLSLIDDYRDKGLVTPFTADVLVRAGIQNSLVNRTLRALEGLDLIDMAGNPTPALEEIRRATTADYKARLEAVVRGAYAEVFQFTDPAKDDATRIADAFRAYEPIGQRGRMVTLFLGLCKAAGIIPDSAPAVKAPAARPTRAANPFARKSAAARTSRTPAPDGDVQHPAFQAGAVPPAIMGLLAMLPRSGTGWTKADRNRFVITFKSVLDYSFPVQDHEPSGWDAVEDDDDQDVDA